MRMVISALCQLLLVGGPENRSPRGFWTSQRPSNANMGQVAVGVGLEDQCLHFVSGGMPFARDTCVIMPV